jgi:hypothetical protein
MDRELLACVMGGVDIRPDLEIELFVLRPAQAA